ncbi:DCL family protein [Mesorhizobium sp. M0915]|uniref:DCL family protein n=1 Tax=Mesorhizobium sp. M0915 TaxID=2957027 RepID=UPI003339EDE3
MLSRYPANSVVSDVDAADLEALLMRHPEFTEKVGNGIHHFEVIDADYGTTCFCVIRNNGSRVRFSYITCVNTEPSHQIGDLA